MRPQTSPLDQLESVIFRVRGGCSMGAAAEAAIDLRRILPIGVDVKFIHNEKTYSADIVILDADGRK